MIVTAVAQNPEGAASNYRVIQPLVLAKENVPDTDSMIIGHNIKPGMHTQAIRDADVALYQSPMLPSVAEHIRWLSKDKKVLTVVDNDDNIWELDPLNPAYGVFGILEVKLPNGQYLWKTGQRGFDPERNKKALEAFNESIKNADLITATTPQLAGLYEEQARRLGNPKAKAIALPNCVDLRMWEPTEIVKPKDEVRIIYQGSDSHYRDYDMILDPLAEVCKKFPNVKIVIAGMMYKSLKKKISEKQIIHNDKWTSFDAHPYRMRLLGADIGVCPLVENAYSRCKSEIKFTEYGALSLPVVASDTLIYQEVIKDGENGYLAKTPKQWVERLSQLVQNENLRKRIGANARKWVEENRDAVKSAHKWTDTYQKALDDKLRLNSDSTKTP